MENCIYIFFQDNSVISGQTPQNGNGNGASRPGSISRASGFNPETNSNAYATINKLPLVATASRRRSLLGLVTPMDHHERDYATLEKMSPRSPPGPIGKYFNNIFFP